MSQKNVDAVRAMFRAFSASDFDLDDWLNEFFDAEIEWHDTPTYPSAGVHFGREALRRHAADYLEAWTEWSVEIEHIRALEDRVVAHIRYGGVGRQSGIGRDVGGNDAGAIFEFREGRILRVEQFETYAEALEAVGLSEQDAQADPA